MRKSRLLISSLIGASAPWMAAASMASAPPAPFAVVELFTSEGCSSCPPADRLLSELAADAEKTGRPVFALSFHVDYWNYLGWADPFSRSEFSDRQQEYARAMDGRVYTPQMIVNGSEEFVGSQGGTARKSIENALEHSAGAAIALHPGNVVEGRLNVAYQVTGQGDGDFLNLAVVEKGLAVPVKSGENRGRTLKHDNVVRSFRTVVLDKQGMGDTRLELPPGMRRGNAMLIGYVQKRLSLRTIGAARSAF